MIHDIFMPALSSTMTEGKIVSWTKSPGDKVAKGETVLVVESDKADMDVESFHEGYLAAILVEAGQEAAVGATLALIAETEEEIAQARAKGSTMVSREELPQPAPQIEPEIVIPVAPIPPAPAPTMTTSGGNGRIIASPRAKKLAQEYGVNLKTISGSGPYGRITSSDVERAAGKGTKPTQVTTFAPSANPVAQPPAAPVSVPPTPISVPLGEIVPLTTLQKAVVQNMMASLQAPTFHVGYTITTDALDALYKQLKGKGVTMTALLAKAVALTLQKHPLVNSSYTEQGIQYHGAINVAMAVAMPDGGLITPVLPNADQLDIYSLSRLWKDLVERARAKQLQPQEYNSGTITLSNLGMFGVDRFDAILPPGQAAILAIGASRPQVVATADGLFGIKNQMCVNITCDHRVVYGMQAAAFLQDLANLIENQTQSLTM